MHVNQMENVKGKCVKQINIILDFWSFNSINKRFSLSLKDYHLHTLTLLFDFLFKTFSFNQKMLCLLDGLLYYSNHVSNQQHKIKVNC